MRKIFRFLLLIILFLSKISCVASDSSSGKSEKANDFTDSAYSRHLEKLRKKILSKDFTVIIQKPFVVISDESPERVRYMAENVVKWAVTRLKQMYFKKDPLYIIDIWLFKGKASYRKYTREIFKDNPDTPFGYSSTRHRALIMNVRTGTGTLVHEIVHPFMAANFPRCPAWFNEGLASLYEQSTGRGNRIIGLTNWRLAGIQEAIRKGIVPSFKKLTSTTEYEFYEKDPGTNYAQARYLCYYLQEKGVLVKFYHAFLSNRQIDPTGYHTLKEVLGERDMDQFKKKWEEFVLYLRF